MVFQCLHSSAAGLSLTRGGVTNCDFTAVSPDNGNSSTPYGTAAEVTPVRELDGRMIGSGSRGPITEQLQTAYFDCVEGRSERHADWLTYV